MLKNESILASCIQITKLDHILHYCNEPLLKINLKRCHILKYILYIYIYKYQNIIFTT